MNVIQASDTIMARGTYLGRTVVDFASTGFENINDVLSAVAMSAGNLRGLLRISLRNSTRGWSQVRSMFVAPAPPGTQLTLF